MSQRTEFQRFMVAKAMHDFGMPHWEQDLDLPQEWRQVKPSGKKVLFVRADGEWRRTVWMRFD